MSLPEFIYETPATVSEVCAMLEKYQGRAEVIAGGTDLLVSMKQRVKAPECLISLKKVSGLRYIRRNGEELQIGAMTTIGDLVRSREVKKSYPVLAEAARCLASPNLRNVATVGGNICLDTRCLYYNKAVPFRKAIGACLKFGGDVCHVAKASKKCFAVSQADLVPALIALGAKVKVNGAREERVVPLEELYRADGKDYLALKRGEIVSEVRIPGAAPGTGGSYQKIRLHKSTDFAYVSAAVNLNIKEGVCEDIRIVLGSAASSPVRLFKAEGFLKGKKITGDLIEEAGAIAYQAAKPVGNMINAGPSYRKEAARVMVVQAINEALSRFG